MKDARLEQILKFNGKLARVIGEISGQRCVIIEYFNKRECPHCKSELWREQEVHVVSSPNFQQGAEKIETITDDNSLVVQ